MLAEVNSVAGQTKQQTGQLELELELEHEHDAVKVEIGISMTSKEVDYGRLIAVHVKDERDT